MLAFVRTVGYIYLAILRRGSDRVDYHVESHQGEAGGFLEGSINNT